MANKKFTARLNESINAMLNDAGLHAFSPDSRSLYSPIYRSAKLEWAKVLDSDGILLTERTVHNAEGAVISPETEILIGVILQSEDATSQTKPNPIGKAAISHIQNGIWVTIKGKRKRIDKLIVAFVLPEGASPKDQKSFTTAKRNVLNASGMMPDAVPIEVPRGISVKDLTIKLTSGVLLGGMS